MRPIPLIRARYLQAFASVLEEAECPPGPLLERLGIHPTLLTDPEAVHPSHQLWAFAGEGARESGVPDLGFRAASRSLDSSGGLGPRVAASSTLREALATFCVEAKKEHSRAAFRIAKGQGSIWFLRERLEGTPDERVQIELLFVGMMLQVVRLAAGREWLPRQVRFQSEDGARLSELIPLTGTELRFGCPTTAVEIPRGLLSASLASNGHLRHRDPAESHLARPPLATDFVGSLRQLLGSCLAEGPPRIEFVARAARCSVRTLQRRLQEADLNYSRLVEQVRLGAAAERLRGATPKLVEIALDAGYSDQANFTRAFRRWAGVPPSHFRRRVVRQGRDEQGLSPAGLPHVIVNDSLPPS